MPQPFDQLPQSVARLSRLMRLGAGVPALLVHPYWHDETRCADRPAPLLLWMHGRTVNKELDPGRYLRLARAGVATCALDLPAHGERADPAMQGPHATLDIVAQMASEIDGVVADLQRLPECAGQPIAIGGMSAGGMAALVRLTHPHSFAAALVECTTGNFRYQQTFSPFPVDRVAALDPMQHLDGWRTLPILGLHNQLDEWVPIEGQRAFFAALRAQTGDPGMAVLHEFPATGAPHEHSGFGRMASTAKDLGTHFLARNLGVALTQ